MSKIITQDEARTRFKVWLYSGNGRSLDGNNINKLMFDNLPIFNIDPEYKSSLVFVRSMWRKKTDQLLSDDDEIIGIYVDGHSYPNNYFAGVGTPTNTTCLAQIPQIRFNGNPPAGSKEETHGYFFQQNGNVKDNGVYCGDTFVNGGAITIWLVGDSGSEFLDANGAYWLELDVQLIKNENKCGC
tara:strand:+ start:1180 stop:1734 length:555 start_codon:yes stop_codon:yes gene_type:complete